MTFSEHYKNHAYADLIQEAETQGISIGVKTEQQRIIKLLEDACVEEPKCKKPCGCYAWEISFIKGEQN